MDIRLETDRLILREYSLDDFETSHEYGQDPEVSQYSSWGPNTEQVTKDFLQLNIEKRLLTPRMDYGLAIELKETSKQIGGVGIRIKATPHKEADLGYVLNKSCWGHGFATEACLKMLEYGFEELNLNRIWAQVMPINRASVRVLEKIGMQKEGIQRQALKVRGEFVDSFLYATIADDWNKSHT